MESLISLSCIALSGNSHDACISALTAGSKQTALEQNVNQIENTVSKQADHQARDLVGNTGMGVGAVVGGAGKAIIDKSATIKFPVFMPQMFINIQVGVDKSMAGLEWKF